MSARGSHVILLVVIGTIFFNLQAAEAYQKYYHGYYKEEPACTFHPDFSTVEAALRSTIFLAKTEEAAKILSSNELFSLGAGLRYRDNETCLVTQTSDPTSDPDIVAIQALALNAEKTWDTEKLARAVVLSFDRECECSLHTAKEKEELTKSIKALLDDPEERRTILEFGTTEEHDPPQDPPTTTTHYTSYHHSGRRLSVTESSPTNSFVCAHCRPRGTCRRSGVRWCQ